MKINKLVSFAEKFIKSDVGLNIRFNIAILAISLVSSIIIARILGPEGRGELASAMLWATFIGYFSMLGVESAIVVKISEKHEDADRVLGSAFLLGSIQSVLGIVVGLVITNHLLSAQSQEVVRYAMIFLLSIPLLIASQYSLSTLQALLRFRVLNYLKLAFPIFYTTSVVGLFLGDIISFKYILITNLIIQSLIVVTGISYLYLINVKPKFQTYFIKPLLTLGMRVWIGSVAQGFNQKLDQTFIANAMTARSLGLYVVAVSFSSLSSGISYAYQLTLLPQISQLKDDNEKIKNFTKAFLRFFLLAILSI
ncbi:MAG: oligosaccharide flippase family protein, partial [Bacteroidota bacterium]